MKRAFLVMLAVFIVMQFIQTEKVNKVTAKELEIKAPKQIMSILKTACYDCHSNEVKWPWYSYVAPFSWVISGHVNDGRAWVNFSEWENYTKEEKEKQLKEIYRTAFVAMPLRSYLWVHGDADLTKEQRDMIRDWTGVRK
ncbi:heme-binding domain-containing protein [Halarcobacter ebronensis]|uniref:Cytochrome C n=1 Tax=Halarcobacter ebronensis TaxID=1462615 RepID=A0A4Q1AHP8_9BACT|nr:heme-binding domain-containing protein [Halarcobacter ebronensis]QKF81162.1 heme-binding domain-containing protein [Halarcobacter ebronensis]RXK03263.1 cytochrome C [Halarcobacter ebronensis]